MKRLPPQPGEWIDRTTPLHFTYEGRAVEGYAGDTVSSALWAADQHALARSFKYHRLRGVLSMANHDANVIVQDGPRLNQRADVLPLRAGMALTAVNTVGGVASDKVRALGLFARFLPVGFYYKAFYSKALAARWERMFRTLTGLGTVDFTTPHVRTPKRYGFCDVLVVGAGPSGLAAALAAAEAGARVVVVDENARAGGSGGYQLGTVRPPGAQTTQALLNRVRAHPKVQLTRSDRRRRLLRRPLGAVRRCAEDVEDARRRRGYRGRRLRAAGRVPQQRPAGRDARLGRCSASCTATPWRRRAGPSSSAAQCGWLPGRARPARRRRRRRRGGRPARRRARQPTGGCRAGAGCIEYLARPRALVEAHAGRDGRVAALTGRTVSAPTANPTSPAVASRIPCDGIAMSTGWAPAANLLYQAGTRMRFDDTLQQFVPAALPPGVFACGRVNGVYAFDAKQADGARAGAPRRGARRLRGRAAAVAVVAAERESPSHPWPIVAHPQGKNFVDFDEDLQVKDFHDAVQEGFDNIELMKRFSTVGMGPSQGKHSNMTALRILARLTGKTPQQVGTTTSRPFFHPVPLSHLAGRAFLPGASVSRPWTHAT